MRYATDKGDGRAERGAVGLKLHDSGWVIASDRGGQRDGAARCYGSRRRGDFDVTRVNAAAAVTSKLPKPVV